MPAMHRNYTALPNRVRRRLRLEDSERTSVAVDVPWSGIVVSDHVWIQAYDTACSRAIGVRHLVTALNEHPQ